MLKIPEIPMDSACYQQLISLDYTASIQGRPCQVRSCRVSAMPFNRVWPGAQRPMDQTIPSAYISFAADEPVVVEVAVKTPFQKVVLRPLASGIVPQVRDGKITVAIPGPGQWVLELDGELRALHIFCNPVRDYPEKSSATYSFGPGVHFAETIELQDGDSVYIDASAVVYGQISGKKVKNVRIFGQGALDGGMFARVFGFCYEDTEHGNMRFYESRGIRIEGVTLLDSANWVIRAFGCRDIEIDNVKIVGQWKYNNDGIDLVNTSDAVIRNCFVRAFDDVIVLKGIPTYQELPVKNIRVENCVLWCGWGRTCEIGIETAAPEYRDIVFRDCFLIHNSASALDIQNGDHADIADVTFENIHVEYSVATGPEIYQESDDQSYEPKGRIGVPDLIFSDNHHYFTESPVFGYTHRITYRNIYVDLEDGVPMPRILIKSWDPKVITQDYRIDGIFVNGRRITDPAEFNLDIRENTADIHWM